MPNSGGGGGGTSSFNGTAGRIPLFNSLTGGVNSCLADSGTSIFNAYGTENLNVSSFTSVTWPPVVTFATFNATVANLTQINTASLMLNGPLVLDTPIAAIAPSAPATGHSRLAVQTDGYFGVYAAGDTQYRDIPLQDGMFPPCGNINASGTHRIYADASYFSATCPTYTGSDNGASILAAENANTT